MTLYSAETVWHNDGHVMLLELNRADLKILAVNCPKEGACQHEVYGCIVEYFLRRFGLDCNVGIAPPSAEMPIAWTLIGHPHDPDAAQVWVIPTNDEAFAAWLITQHD